MKKSNELKQDLKRTGEEEKMLDQELESLLESMPEDDLLEKNIERRIKQKIQRTVLRTIAVVASVVVTLVLIINPCMNAMFLNPAKLNQESDQQMLRTLNAYWETMQPYVEIVRFTAEKKGFARYDLEMQVTDQRSPLYYGKANVWAEMICGKYENWKDPDSRMVHLMGRFDEMVEPERTKEEIRKANEELLDEIRELPKSAQLYLSVVEKNPKTLEALRKEKVTVNWVEVYQPNVKFQGGLGMHKSVLEENQDIREELTAEELKEVYISNLEDLMEHELIWRAFGLCDSSYIYPDPAVAMELLKETCEDAKKLETLETRKYCISGKRDEILEYLEKTDIAHVLVDEVKLSKLS